MNVDDLIRMHEETCEKARSIMRAKNHDYTGGGDGGDPFANFRASEILDVPAEIGVLARCIDKFQRIKAFATKGELKVKEESVNDAIEDVINYMILLKGIISEKGDSITEKQERSCSTCRFMTCNAKQQPCASCELDDPYELRNWLPAFQEGPS